MALLINIIIFLLILSVLVIVHELGHFLTAKSFGVGVSEFAVGMPPRIKKLFRWWDTDFVLNALPLGGYCSLMGEDEQPAAKKDAECPDNPKFFYCHPAWQRFLVISGGPIANFVLAVIIFVIVFSVMGIPQQTPGQVYIDYVEPGSPAESAGLTAASQITAIETEVGEQFSITDVDELMTMIKTNQGKTLFITTVSDCKNGQCSGNPQTASAYVRLDSERGANSGALGVLLTDYQSFYFPWYKHFALSAYYGSKQSLLMAKDMIVGLAQAIKGIFIRQDDQQLVVMGPVGIVAELNRQQTFSEGFLIIIQFAGLLSLNLGIVNLLPIPAVDGGRLLLIILEKVVGRGRIAKIEAGLNYAGFIFIMGLAVLITGHDIWRIFTS